ncbi:MAG TPA: CtsR family transcriptional regulator [Eubacteriales bacterium]|jgi:transcriptional regulator CtsR|nr:CtsR family transcriptional regulator [Clostridia bacterium]HRR89480.1 CtsR family transcriptional regulator [Eubacteriales bacterium]HRU84390.1 CtsR family transcriptional regulator [Eubacteriales bacterium]
MASISDIIEQFILSLLSGDEGVDLSRNELALYFGCAPSQINYVLATRFTPSRGYLIESRRGGGGFIRVVRLPASGAEYLNSIAEAISVELSYKDAVHILERLTYDGYINENEGRLLLYAISPKALKSPAKLENVIRANIIKAVISELMR